MERITKSENRFSDLDLTVPINTQDIMSKIKSDDCFGKAWDIRTLECAKCGERDVCGIVFNSNVVKPKVEQVQQDQGAIFLDLADFDRVTKKDIFNWVVSGETKAKELLAYVMGKAKTDDTKAGVEWLKRFITNTEGINTKAGVVWIS